MAQRALRGYLLGGWRGGSAVGVRTLSGHLAPAGRSSPLSFRGQRHRSQTPPPRGPRRLAWPGRHPLQPGGPGRSQLLSQPLFKPRRRFPLGESPRGWDGRGPNLKSLTPAVRPLVPGCEGAAGTELPPLGPAQAGSSPRALLAPLLHLKPEPVCRGPWSQPPTTVYGVQWLPAGLRPAACFLGRWLLWARLSAPEAAGFPGGRPRGCGGAPSAETGTSQGSPPGPPPAGGLSRRPGRWRHVALLVQSTERPTRMVPKGSRQST